MINTVSRTYDDPRVLEPFGATSFRLARDESGGWRVVGRVGTNISPDYDSEHGADLGELIGLIEVSSRDEFTEFIHQDPVRRARADAQLISLEMHIEDDLSGVALGHVEMEQILLNLVVNARDSIDEEGKIIVEAGPSESRGAILLTVTDDGSGIEPDRIDHIFDPFYSTKGDRARGSD